MTLHVITLNQFRILIDRHDETPLGLSNHRNPTSSDNKDEEEESKVEGVMNHNLPLATRRHNHLTGTAHDPLLGCYRRHLILLHYYS